MQDLDVGSAGTAGRKVIPATKPAYITLLILFTFVSPLGAREAGVVNPARHDAVRMPNSFVLRCSATVDGATQTRQAARHPVLAERRSNKPFGGVNVVQPLFEL